MLAAGRSRKEGERSHTVCMARASDAAGAAWQQSRAVPGAGSAVPVARKEQDTTPPPRRRAVQVLDGLFSYGGPSSDDPRPIRQSAGLSSYGLFKSWMAFFNKKRPRVGDVLL